MSRTDKDMPDWVTAEWYEPVHFRCTAQSIYTWRRSYGPGDGHCDLPDTPVRGQDRFMRLWRPGARSCFWEADLSHVHPTGPPPRWYVEHRWHNPERVRVRDELRAAAAEWRATGDVEHDPAPRQARHSATWSWS